MLQILCQKKRPLPGILLLYQGVNKRQKQTQALRRNLGQTAIEMVLALVATFLLIFGTIRLFVWLNRCIVERHQAYEDTRLDAGSIDPGQKFEDEDPTTNVWTPPKPFE